MIIGFGFIITIQSIIIAAKKPSIWSVLVALYNSFAMAFDIYVYATSLKESLSVIRSTGRRSQGNGIMIIVIAILIAALMVHAAYKHGYKKAMSTQSYANARRGQAKRSGMVEGNG